MSMFYTAYLFYGILLKLSTKLAEDTLFEISEGNDDEFQISDTVAVQMFGDTVASGNLRHALVIRKSVIEVDDSLEDAIPIGTLQVEATWNSDLEAVVASVIKSLGGTDNVQTTKPSWYLDGLYG